MRKNNLTKKIICILIAIIGVSIIVTGALIKFKNYRQTESSEEIIDSIEQYLYDKYDYMGIQVIGFERANNWDHANVDVLNFKIIGDSDEKTITAKREKKDDKYIFYDNYFSYLIEDEFDSFIKKYTDNYFKTSFVDSNLKNCFTSDSINKSSTLNNFLKQEFGNADIIIAVKESDYNKGEFNELSDQLVDAILVMNLDMTISLRIASFKDDKFNEINETNINEIIQSENKIEENSYLLIDGEISSKNSVAVENETKDEKSKDKIVVANNLIEFENYMQNIHSQFANYETYEVDYENISFFAYKADNQNGFNFDLLYNNNKLDVYEIDEEYSFSTSIFEIIESDTDVKFALLLQITSVGSNEKYKLVVFNDSGQVLLSKDIVSDDGQIQPIETYINEIM